MAIPCRSNLEIRKHLLTEFPDELIKAEIHFRLDLIKQEATFQPVEGVIRGVVVDLQRVQQESRNNE